MGYPEARNVACGARPRLLRQLIRNLEHVAARGLELDLSAEEARRNALDDTRLSQPGLGPGTIYSGRV